MKKIIISITIISFLNLIGCYSSKVISKDILIIENQEQKFNDLTIVNNESKRFEFTQGTYQVVNDTLFVNGLKPGANFMEQLDFNIALSDIEHLELDELNTLATVGFVSLIVATITAGIILYIGLHKW
jgi:hypothetical protein